MRDREADWPAEEPGQGRRRGPRLCLAGSSRLQHAPSELIDIVAGLPPSTKLLLRSGNLSAPGFFEQVMAKMAMTLWLDVEWYRPDPEDGEGANFDRDVRMVKSSDLVLAFFWTLTMIGGTAHVVDMAINFDVPVYAYGFDRGKTEKFMRIGEHDPGNAWGNVVP